MRRFHIVTSALLVAACSSTPRPEPVTPVATPKVRETGQLIGLGESELIARFGRPTFQVREGVGVKWQWANAGCVLDAYLYPGNSSALHVTHVDARRPNGSDTDSNACAVSLTR